MKQATAPHTIRDGLFFSVEVNAGINFIFSPTVFVAYVVALVMPKRCLKSNRQLNALNQFIE